MTTVKHNLSWAILGVIVLLWPGVAAASKDILYVTNSGGNDITLVDVETLKVIGSIETGDTPHGLEASPDGSRIYISGETDDDVVAIDTATSKVLWRAYVGDRPNHIAVSADGRYVYVPIRSSDTNDVVDTQARRKIKSLKVGSSPHNAYLSPDGKSIYATSMGDHQVTIIDVATQSVVGSIPVGGVPRPAGFSKDNKLMYVGLTGLHGFVVADIAKRKVIERVELPPADVEVVSTMGYTPTHGLGFRPDNKQFWITNVFNNSVEALSVPEHKVLADIPVGEAPNWMTFGKDGKFLYVSNAGTHDVSVIDTEAMKEVGRVGVGLAPKRLLVVSVPKGMDGPNDTGWSSAAQRASSTDYYLKGGGMVSCESWSFRKELTEGTLRLPDLPAIFRKNGIRGISIKTDYFESLQRDYLFSVRDAIEENERVLTSLIVDGNVVTDDEEATQKAIDNYVQFIMVAKFLKAPVVRLGVGRTGKGDDADQTVGVERAIKAFRKVLPIAKQMGIRLAVENHPGPTRTADAMLRIVKETDPEWVGVLLDTGGWDEKIMYDEFEKLAPHVYHVHAEANSFDKYGDETTIDYGKALDSLESVGYGGALSIEWKGDIDTVEGIGKMRDLLVKYWHGTAKTVEAP